MFRDIPQNGRLDLNRIFRARVIRNDDERLEGRIGVFIPSLMTSYAGSQDEPAPNDLAIIPDFVENAADLGLANTVKEDVYVWARPEHYVDGSRGGTYWVPTTGSTVLVYFENGDPNRLYWKPATAHLVDDILPQEGLSIVRGNTAGNLEDPKKKPQFDLLREWPNGTSLYYDWNEDTNVLMIVLNNTHRIFLEKGDQGNAIEMQTEQGHLIRLDELSTEMTFRTQSGKVDVVYRDSDGAISIENPSGTTSVLSDEMHFTTQTGKVNVSYKDSDGSVSIDNPGGATTIKSATIHLNP